MINSKVIYHINVCSVDWPCRLSRSCANSRRTRRWPWSPPAWGRRAARRIYRRRWRHRASWPLSPSCRRWRTCPCCATICCTAPGCGRSPAAPVFASWSGLCTPTLQPNVGYQRRLTEGSLTIFTIDVNSWSRFYESAQAKLTYRAYFDLAINLPRLFWLSDLTTRMWVLWSGTATIV